jgi:hypothetical protein
MNLLFKCLDSFILFSHLFVFRSNDLLKTVNFSLFQVHKVFDLLDLNFVCRDIVDKFVKLKESHASLNLLNDL